MHIDLTSLVLQIINFAILVWLLRRFLYRPVLTFVARRQQKVESILADVAEKQARAESARKAYEEKIASAVGEQNAMINKARADMVEERNHILEQTRDEAKQILERNRLTLENDRRTLSLQLIEESCRLATAISSRLLIDIAGASVDEIFFQRLDTQISGLPSDQLSDIRRSLANNGGAEIVTASPIDEARQTYWRTRLAEILPEIGQCSFRCDPDLIAGVEIRYSTGVVAVTWRKSLESAKQTLLRHEAAA